MKRSFLLHTNKNPAPVNFKALIYETSVYKYYVELKEDAFTKEGLFDLAKVPELSIIGAAQFLRDIRGKKSLRQKDMAKILNVHPSQVNHWENDRRIPLQMLIKIAEENNVSRDTIYSLIDQGAFSLKTALPIKFERISELIQYFSPPQKYNWAITLINCTKETLSKIKNMLNVKLKTRSKCKRIQSKELHNYLTTFFRYTKVSKIQPPLTYEVKLLYENGVDLKRAIICPCLQSDGDSNHRKPSLRFYGANKILHDYFVDAMYYTFNELPSSYFMPICACNCYYTEYGKKSAKSIVNEVRNLAGSTKTSPSHGQTIRGYLKEPQPHLNYLTNASEIDQKIALRIWASTEGFVTIRRRHGWIIPIWGISCAHPDLATQLKQIALRRNIFFGKKREKTSWSGITSLNNETINAFINFLKLGGFIKNVKISASSRYHEGIDKDVLALGILEFIKREKTSHKLKNLSIEKVHEEINKFIKNREYNTANYYINFFSKDDSVV